MSVTLGAGDYARIALTAPFVTGRLLVVQRAVRIPGLRRLTNAYVLRLLKRRLKAYGTPEFTSDSAEYTPSGKAA